jgi:hypothetical protein
MEQASIPEPEQISNEMHEAIERIRRLVVKLNSEMQLPQDRERSRATQAQQQ